MIWILVAIGSILGLFGGVVFLFDTKISKALANLSIPFAAGVLLSVSFLHILPEAFEIGGNFMGFIVLFTFVLSFIFESTILNIHHHDCSDCDHVNFSPMLLMLGDTIHNAIDGAAIAAAYLVDPSLGVVVAISSFLHEVPHEVGDFGVLIKSGFSKTKAMILNFISALSAFIGAFFVIYFSQIFENSLSLLLAITGGMFIYLGASDFLPHTKENFRLTKIVSFLLGILIMMIIFVFLPHHE